MWIADKLHFFLIFKITRNYLIMYHWNTINEVDNLKRNTSIINIIIILSLINYHAPYTVFTKKKKKKILELSSNYFLSSKKDSTIKTLY